MSSFHIRPRFRQVVGMEREAVQSKLAGELRDDKDQCELKCFPDFMTIRIPEKDRHLWSPRLTLSFEANEEEKTIIHGIYGPNANLWAMFLYAYLFSGSIALFSGLFAYSQWAIGHYMWALFIFIPAAAVIVGLYVFAQVGQKLGAQQTFRLHQAYEEAIGTPIEIH